MIGYVMMGSNDLPKSAAFYDRIFAPLGLTRAEEADEYVG
jgi:hypothetical protein